MIKMSPELFVERCADFRPVSHETVLKLQAYEELLKKWQAKINLVSPTTLNDIWPRHFYDSAQLLSYISDDQRVLDFGSGAGFPAMVLAIMGVKQVTAIESDQRKMAFLQEVARITETKINLINQRIEAVAPFEVDVITARAFAPLDKLLGFAAPWWRDGVRGIFLKGANVKEELTAASALWHIECRCEASRADPSGSVLTIEGLNKISA